MSQRTTPVLVSRTDVGLERQENQDAFGSAQAEGVFFAFVCDGMGGHQGGSTASHLAVETLTVHLRDGVRDLAERMRNAVVEANRAIFSLARTRRDLAKMGTTAVILAVDLEAGLAHVAHVGDSRLYLIRAGVIRRITRDHTMVQALVDDGIIDPEQARNHPNSNIITRSLGGREEVDAEIFGERLELQPGDLYVLCSDGLYGQVEEHVIAQVATTLPLDEAADRLIELACEAGGPDNITVQLVQIDGPPQQSSSWEIEHPPILRPRRPRGDSGAVRQMEEVVETPTAPRRSLSGAIRPVTMAMDAIGGGAATGSAPHGAPMTEESGEDGFVFVLIGIAVAVTLGLLLIVFTGGYNLPVRNVESVAPERNDSENQAPID